MCIFCNFVNSARRAKGGHSTRSFVAPSFTGALLLRAGAFGITTDAQADSPAACILATSPRRGSS